MAEGDPQRPFEDPNDVVFHDDMEVNTTKLIATGITPRSEWKYIGHGRFGEVWEAQNTESLGRVAVKQLIGNASPVQSRKFLYEIAMLTKLKSGMGLVHFIGWQRETSGTIAAIFELLGGSVVDQIGTRALSLREALDVVEAAAMALG
eukprot:gene57826-biopygen32918